MRAPAQPNGPTGGGLAGALKTVLFGAIGLRRKADHERETQAVNPLHLVIAATACAALFVLTLIAILRVVTG